MVTKPFSRVLFRFGSIFSVPEIMRDDQLGSFRNEVEDDLIKEYEAASLLEKITRESCCLLEYSIPYS